MTIAYDGEGRKMTIMGGSGTEQLKDELQVQVEDRDLKITLMWTVEDFEDKLDMMRTGYAQYQNQQKIKYVYN